MSIILNKAKRLYNQVRGLFPSELPQGMTAFEQWVKSIQETYSLPTEDYDSICFTFASMIMHLGPTKAYKSKFFFVISLRAASAKQVAGATFQDIKIRQQEAAKKAAAEATANSAVASDGQQPV